MVATVRADILHTILAGPILGYPGPRSGARKSGVESVSSPVEVVLAVIRLLLTGCRKSEILTLRWSE